MPSVKSSRSFYWKWSLAISRISTVIIRLVSKRNTHLPTILSTSQTTSSSTSSSVVGFFSHYHSNLTFQVKHTLSVFYFSKRILSRSHQNSRLTYTHQSLQMLTSSQSSIFDFHHQLNYQNFEETHFFLNQQLTSRETAKKLRNLRSKTFVLEFAIEQVLRYEKKKQRKKAIE